jgi:hypothetical protein
MVDDILLGAWEAAWDVVFGSWVLLACEAAKGSTERKEACTVDGRGGNRTKKINDLFLVHLFAFK